VNRPGYPPYFRPRSDDEISTLYERVEQRLRTSMGLMERLTALLDAARGYADDGDAAHARLPAHPVLAGAGFFVCSPGGRRLEDDCPAAELSALEAQAAALQADVRALEAISTPPQLLRLSAPAPPGPPHPVGPPPVAPVAPAAPASASELA